MKKGGFGFVGFDTEYFFDENNELVFVSYQFYIITDDLEEGWVFVSKHGRKLNFKDFLVFFNKLYNIKKWVFVAFYGVVDYLKFEDYKDFVKYCKLNQNTIFGRFNYEFLDHNRNKKTFFIDIKDARLLAGGGSLKSLGKEIGISKIDIGENIKRMKDFYNENREMFLNYAINDAVIAVKYFEMLVRKIEEVFGMDKNLVFKINTASGIGEKYFSNIVLKNVDKNEYFGKRKIEKIYWNKHLKRLMKFVKVDFDKELNFWKEAYFGGRNETYLFGYFKSVEWYDYDIKNAYPLAMLSIQDVDWFDRYSIKNDNIHLLDFNDIGFIKLEFEFKEDVGYPVFPVKTDYGLIFPRKGKTYVSIPEFLVALKNNLLKDFYILEGIKFRKKESLTIPSFIKDVVEERSKYPKNTLENKLWKLVANGFYGKLAQGFTGKKSLDLKNTIEKGVRTYKSVGKSNISNVFLAGFITGVVRAIVAEYANYFYKRNIVNIVNITTDGFMINKKLTDDELKGVGYLTKKYSILRKKFLNDDYILELKHFGFGNNVAIKTRGYWLEPKENNKVLIARGGIQTKNIEKIGKDEFEKQKLVYEFLTKNFLEANYNSIYKQNNLTNIGDVLLGDVNDIVNVEREVSMNFDFDFKRKPVDFTDEFIEFGGKVYKKLKINKTVAWENVEEFLLFKKGYEKFKKYKTNINKIQNKKDLEEFFEYVKVSKFSDTRVKNLEQVVLTKIIYVLLLNNYSNKEIAEILNISVKKVEKRKYSKSFQKIKEKGTVGKVNERDFNEVFKPFIIENIKDRNIQNLLFQELLENEKRDVSIFEIL